MVKQVTAPTFVSFPDRAAWRAWLAAHHRSSNDVWLAFYKKGTGKPTVAYEEAVEEALCFGWIDSIIRRVDSEKYAQRFSPRKDANRWSPKNIERAGRMIRQGRMTEAGLEKFRGAKAHAAPASKPGLALSPELLTDLRANAKAARNFERLPPGQRRLYVGWIMSAKKEDTRRRRLSEAIGRLERGLVLGMK